MSGDTGALKAAVVGAGRMCRRHAAAMAESGTFTLSAVCDISRQAAREAADELDATPYTDLEEMLAAEQPAVVTIATPGATHADLTEQVAAGGVNGICCEKPMATSLGDGRRMVRACRGNDVALIVNHQRRMGEEMVCMRRLTEEGAIGELRLLRGSCAGDLLTDGTHLVNSLRHLAGDEQAEWVLGQVHRKRPDPSEPKSTNTRKSGGYRYGYPVEDGAVAVVGLKSGLRLELFTGDTRLQDRPYQDYEAVGTTGRLWREGDNGEPPLRILDDHEPGWRSAPLGDTEPAPMARSYLAFARTLREGTPHPLAGESVLKGLEIITAIHESARCKRRIDLPLQQDAYPLALMLEEGRV